MDGKTNAGSAGQIYYLGTGTSFDVSGIPGYQNFTEDNFIIDLVSLKCNVSSWGVGESSASGSNTSVVNKTYDATAGTLKISGAGISASARHINGGCGASASTSLTINVYLVAGKINCI